MPYSFVRFGRVATLVVLGLLSGLPVGPVRASGGGEDDEKGPTPPVHTASSLRSSLLYGDGVVTEADGVEAAGGRRIVPLAFGLSAVVPGLGQAYNRQWIKAGVVVAAEAALIAGYTSWRHQGIDGRDAYQAYAHTHWSPLRYALWLNDYIVYLDTAFETPISATPIDITDAMRGIDFQNPDGWTGEQHLLVRNLIRRIQQVESNVYHPETGASFSHKLPFFPEQQYYELIGKYFQFAPGWSDYPSWVDEDGNFLQSIDPEMTGPGGSKPNVSDRFYDYARDHGRANDYLRRASRLSLLFVVNHLFAAVDAAVFARVHNNRVQARLQMGYDVAGEPQPMAAVTVQF